MSPVPFAEFMNVRISGHYSRLLNRSVFEDLLGGDSLATVTTFLLDHPGYSSHIEHALDHLPEREGLEAGVTSYFSKTVGDLYNMSDDLLKEQYGIALFSFEIRNISTIILSHARHRSFSDMAVTLLPSGVFNAQKIRTAYEKGSFPDLMKFLTAHHPLRFVLGHAYKASKPAEPVVDLITRFEVKALEYILSNLIRPDNKVLRKVFRLEIDRQNIVTALKAVWGGGPGSESRKVLFAKGGNVNLDTLNSILQVKSPDEALEIIESTPFNEAIEKGIIYYAETGFLHELERFFEEVFIRRTQHLRRFDAFGAGPFIGYIWAHYVEMTNLRLIINGIAFRTGAGQIRKGLIYV